MIAQGLVPRSAFIERFRAAVESYEMDARADIIHFTWIIWRSTKPAHLGSRGFRSKDLHQESRLMDGQRWGRWLYLAIVLTTGPTTDAREPHLRMYDSIVVGRYDLPTNRGAEPSCRSRSSTKPW
jgi:hypothetical protein